MFDLIDYYLAALIGLMIVINVVIEVKRAKDREKQRELDAERVEIMNRFDKNLVEFGKIARSLTPDVVEAASLKLLGNSLIEQLIEHGDKMDQLSKQQEAVFMPLVNVEGTIDPEELEKMIDETIKTGIVTLPREETTVIYNKTPIDADIVEAFEKRIKYYEQRPLQDYKANPKRTFLADFEQIDEWTGEYAALNKIQNFDTIVTLLSGHYYPVKEWMV